MTWERATLGEIATIERKGVDASDIASGTEFVGLEHIQSGGEIIGSQCVENGEISSTKFRFTQAHVLYGKLRPYLAKIALPDFEGICSTDILPIAPGPNLDRRYLAYFLRQPSMVDFANSRSTGANLPRLSPKVLATFQIPLPPLEEQRRIAAILHKADAVRRKRKEAIALTEELLRSAFLEMFGDPVTNPKGWEIAELLQVSEDISYGITASSNSVPTSTKMLRITDIQDDSVDWLSVPYCEANNKDIEKYSLNSGDIVFARTGATTGKSFLIRDCPADTLFASYLIRVRPSALIDHIYLSHFFQTDYYWSQVRQNSSGSAQPGVNSSKLKKLLVCMPPLELQQRFSKFELSVRADICKMKEAGSTEDNLFNSLLQRAFRGEL